MISPNDLREKIKNENEKKYASDLDQLLRSINIKMENSDFIKVADPPFHILLKNIEVEEDLLKDSIFLSIVQEKVNKSGWYFEIIKKDDELFNYVDIVLKEIGLFSSSSFVGYLANPYDTTSIYKGN